MSLVEVPEVSPFVQRAVEIGPDSAGLGGEPGAIERAVEFVFSGAQLVVEPHIELGCSAEEVGSKTDVADIGNAIRRTGAEGVSAGDRAAQVAQTGGGISRGRKLSQEISCHGIGEFRGYVIAELLRFHGVDLRRRSGLA